jgi:hypothetical protein
MTSYRDGAFLSAPIRWSAGLWRGMVIDPADGGFDGTRCWSIHDIRREISRGADPIQDVKGLGVNLVSVFSKPGYFRPHFRQHDADFNRVMRTALPIYHDACVRVLCEHLRSGGYAAFKPMCRYDVLPAERFDFAAVESERSVASGPQVYRPDILIRAVQKEVPDIEVELVNTHAPTDLRLAAAEDRGALVVWADIRGIVQDLVLDNRRDLVPDDAVLLSRVKGLSFQAVSSKSKTYTRLHDWAAAERGSRSARQEHLRASRAAAWAEEMAAHQERRNRASEAAEAAAKAAQEAQAARNAETLHGIAAVVEGALASANTQKLSGDLDKAVSTLESLLTQRKLRVCTPEVLSLRQKIHSEIKKLTRCA